MTVLVVAANAGADVEAPVGPGIASAVGVVTVVASPTVAGGGAGAAIDAVALGRGVDGVTGAEVWGCGFVELAALEFADDVAGVASSAERLARGPVDRWLVQPAVAATTSAHESARARAGTTAMRRERGTGPG
ncbi:MAG: hypothetical protein ACRDV3_14650 [Acidothermaceae bacterium]